MTFTNGLLLGGYIVGATATFFLVGFFCVLGGNPADIWRPFAYAAVWPLFWIWLVLDVLGLI